MTHDVLVVGGGVGGLTVAALLAARGADVCLIERDSRAGGCASAFERMGYAFERGAGLYSSWSVGEIHERIFAELPVAAPETREASPFVVRLSHEAEVRLSRDAKEFEASLRAAFPECADAATSFYRDALETANALEGAAQTARDPSTASKLERLRFALREPRTASRIFGARKQSAAQRLEGASARFRRFVDAQLYAFTQRDSRECGYLQAAVSLAQPLRGMCAMRGGAQALADALADAIKACGGKLRLNAHALRLAYRTDGSVAGVDLLSGERVEARRAIVSNLTVWDTYGKLIGASRTPKDVSASLKRLRGWGAYLLFVALEESAAMRLPAEHVLALTGSSEDAEFNPESSLIMFDSAPAWDARAPEGFRAATVSTFTEAERWFAFHEDETEREAQDQAALESLWERLHASLPELGDGVEAIETETPRDYYERTRRRLGMIGAPFIINEAENLEAFTHRTVFPNLYMVGDTVSAGSGLASVAQSALVVANEIVPPR